MVYVDLEELPTLFDEHPLWSSRGRNVATFTRGDHLGDPAVALDASVRELVQTRTGVRPSGPIRLLTHFRYLGYRFNPVSFFYCYDAQDQLETIVAEVNNTPWGEQHAYVLSNEINRGSADRPCYEFGKSFHVSPFMPMEQDYRWRFSSPGDALSVHMENFEQSHRCFDATMTLKREEMTRRSMSAVLLRYPIMTARVMGAIYWQALRLWWKRTPVHDHPVSAAAGT